MDTNECQTVIAAARSTNGLSSEETLRRLDEAAAAFTKATRQQFRRDAEW
jgi:hypothetical protein